MRNGQTNGGVFLDTVGLVALWDRRDQWHAVASAAFVRHGLHRRPLLSTTYVMLECGNAAARRPYRHLAVETQERLTRDRTLIEPSDADKAEGWSAYARGLYGGAGIVDCISIAVLRRLGVAEVFGNDSHFRAAGFVTLF